MRDVARDAMDAIERVFVFSVLQENMASLASGDEEKFAIISQAIQKDEKIFRLNDKILEHDKVTAGNYSFEHVWSGKKFHQSIS